MKHIAELHSEKRQALGAGRAIERNAVQGHGAGGETPIAAATGEPAAAPAVVSPGISVGGLAFNPSDFGGAREAVASPDDDDFAGFTPGHGREWTFNGRREQKPPDGDWRTWLIMGGRGSGKTRAGAEWVHALASAEERSDLRIALVAETLGCA